MTLADGQAECAEGNKLCRPVVIVLWFLPILALGAMVWRYAVDVPFWDDFDEGLVFLRFRKAGIYLSELIRQNNESRSVFPRLLYYSMALMTRWDPRYQMWASVILVGITSSILLTVAGRTIRNRRAAFAVALLVNVLLCSPVQWQNFLWANQFIVFVPTFCLAVILALVGSRINVWLATLAAAAVAIVSTYSFANGLVVWMAGAPLFFFHPSRHHLKLLTTWFMVMAVTLICYFHGYERPPQMPSMLIALQRPLATLWFFLAYLGNGMRPGVNLQLDVRFGAAAASFWGIGCVYVLVVAWNRQLLQRALPWMVFGGYSIATGLMSAVGRIGFGVPGALEQRYPTFALPLWASLVPIWVVIIQHLIEQNKLRPMFAGLITGTMTAAILALSVNGDLFIRQELTDFANARLAERAIIQYSATVYEKEAIAAAVFPDTVSCRNWIKELDQNDLLHAGLFRTNDISAVEVKDNTILAGSFDRFVLVGHSFELSGWASLPLEKRGADAVLLTTPDEHGVERVIDVVQDWARRPRPDVAAALNCPALAATGWIKGLDQSRFPPGAIITAWAYDSFSRKAYRLMNPKPVPS